MARALRWLTAAAVCWLVVGRGVSIPRLLVDLAAVPVQFVVPPECRITTAPRVPAVGVQPWERVDMPATCPNGDYTVRAVTRDAHGNETTSAPTTFTLARLTPSPALRLYGTTKLYPAAGYLELIWGDDKRRQFGLSLDGRRFVWSVAVQFGRAIVIEGSTVRATVDAPRGTRIRITVAAGRVTYDKDGALIYESAERLLGPAAVELALEDGQTPPGYLTIAGGS
jgi:hypothetical protein